MPASAIEFLVLKPPGERLPWFWRAFHFWILALRTRVKSHGADLVIISGKPASGKSVLLKFLVGSENIVCKIQVALKTGRSHLPIDPAVEIGTRQIVGIDEAQTIDSDHLQAALVSLRAMKKRLVIAMQEYPGAIEHLKLDQDQQRAPKVLIVQLGPVAMGVLPPHAFSASPGRRLAPTPFQVIGPEHCTHRCVRSPTKRD